MRSLLGKFMGQHVICKMYSTCYHEHEWSWKQCESAITTQTQSYTHTAIKKNGNSVCHSLIRAILLILSQTEAPVFVQAYPHHINKIAFLAKEMPVKTNDDTKWNGVSRERAREWERARWLEINMDRGVFTVHVWITHHHWEHIHSIHYTIHRHSE